MSVGDPQIRWSVAASLPVSAFRLLVRWVREGDYFFTQLGIPRENLPGAGGLDLYLWQLHHHSPVQPAMLGAVALLIALFAWLAWRPGVGDSSSGILRQR
jgi:hypothetical protein